MLCPCYLQSCLGIVVLPAGLGALSLTQGNRELGNSRGGGAEGRQVSLCLLGGDDPDPEA